MPSLTRTSPVMSDLRDLGRAFEVPVTGLNQPQISEAIRQKVNSIAGSISIAVSGGYEFNAKAFGAVGNGSTDDTAALQATFNSAVASVTGTLDYRPVIRIPPGVYKITSGLDFRHDTLAIDLQAEGATLQWVPASPATPNQKVIQLGTITYNKITHRGRVDGLWIEGKELIGTYALSTGTYYHYANWALTGHTAIYTHNCNNWEFNYVGARDFLKGIVVASAGYAGHAYNRFEVSRLVNNRYSFFNEITSGGWTNQLKVVGGNWTWNSEALYTNSVKLGVVSTSSAKLTLVSGYVYGDVCVYDPADHRLPWSSVDVGGFDPFVVVVGRGDDAVVLVRDVDYTLDIANKQLTLISATAQAASDRDVSITGLGDDNVIIYLRLKPTDGTYTTYEDATGTVNWSNDATALLLWKGVDDSKLLLRYGKPGIAHGTVTDYTVSGSTVVLAAANIDPDTLGELAPLVIMERPRHVTMFGYRGDSTPSLWTFDACSFEGTAEYADALYAEGGNTLLVVGCRFECEHTAKLGYFLGKGTSDCHILHGAQGDIDDYHGNTEYRDMAVNGKSSRLVRDTWQAKSPTIFGKFGVRTANVQNLVMSIPAIATQTGVGPLLYVGSPASWNPDIGVYSSSGTGAAYSAATFTGPLYYGTLTHATAENYAPLLLRLIASTSVPPSGTGRLGGGIEIDGPTTYLQTSGTDLVVDGTIANKVTSVASSGFTIYQVGYTLEVLGGAGWTTGSYVITGATSGAALLNGSPAALGATGGEFELRSVLTSAIFRIYTRWMTSGYTNRTSLTQFYTADAVNAFQAPLQFTSANGTTQTLLNDYVGIRRWSPLAQAFYCPWVSGDVRTTSYFGSLNPGNAENAITADSYGNTPIIANTYSRYASRSVVTNAVSGGLLIATPIVLAHKSTLDPQTNFGTGLELRADSKPTLSCSAPASDLLVVDGADDKKVTSSFHVFVSGDEGRYLTVSDGVGWTLGKYIIASTSGGAATLNLSPAPVGTSGGVWSVGTYTENLLATLTAKWTNEVEGSRSTRITLSPSCVSGAIDALYVDANSDYTGNISLMVPTGIRANSDKTKAVGAYAPWVSGDSASLPIILVGGVSAGVNNTSIMGQTYSGIGIRGNAVNSGTGVVGDSLTGYGVIARVAAGVHNAVVPALMFSHTCSGTAASGIGVSATFSVATSGATERTLGGITGDWADVVDATRRGRVSLWGNNTVAAVTTSYEGFRVEALAAGAAGLGFYGATATAKPTITGATQSTAEANLLTALSTLGLVTNSTAASGSIRPQRTVTGDTNVTTGDYTVFGNYASPTTGTVTLPNATTCAGSLFVVKNINTGVTTVATGQSIDGAGSYNLTTQYSSITVQSDGAVYFIVGKV